MDRIFVFFLGIVFAVFHTTQVCSYTELSSKTEVSPGCEGGISSQSISTTRDPYLSQEVEESDTDMNANATTNPQCS